MCCIIIPLLNNERDPLIYCYVAPKLASYVIVAGKVVVV